MTVEELQARGLVKGRLYHFKLCDRGMALGRFVAVEDRHQVIPPAVSGAAAQFETVAAVILKETYFVRSDGTESESDGGYVMVADVLDFCESEDQTPTRPLAEVGLLNLRPPSSLYDDGRWRNGNGTALHVLNQHFAVQPPYSHDKALAQLRAAAEYFRTQAWAREDERPVLWYEPEPD